MTQDIDDSTDTPADPIAKLRDQQTNTMLIVPGDHGSPGEAHSYCPGAVAIGSR